MTIWDDSDKRAAVIDAVVRITIDRRSEEDAIELVAREAGITREQFDEAFADLDDCYSHVYEAIAERYRAAVLGAYYEEPNAPWRERMRNAAYATARVTKELEREINWGMIDLFGAPETTHARRDRQIAIYAGIIDEARQELDDPDSMDRSVAEGLAGQIFEATLVAAKRGALSDSMRAVPWLMYMVVLPYFGPEAAEEELRIPPPRD